jgi:acyl-coenzyme A synthetase/AMP-(fatty) acid ligase
MPQSVRVVNVAGEPLHRELVEEIYSSADVRRVFNLYGPTEATTYSTWACIDRGADTPPAIGRPISNTYVYVLSQELEPVPIGVAGEMYIGGAGLARGYVNRPGLTAACFIADPFGVGTRVYRTGDRVRYRADGELSFIGRIDTQLKIRGYRIEPGEIEAALLAHADVQQALVIAQLNASGQPQLTAYVVPQPGVRLEAGELRASLATRLPDYMLPTNIVFLDAFEFTLNGKIDRAALPAPEHARRATTHVPPGTDLEVCVARIWSDVLGVASVGIDDDFFELGGHSLLATRVVARLRSELAVELTVRELFESPVLRDLANRIEGIRWARSNRDTMQALATMTSVEEGRV